MLSRENGGSPMDVTLLVAPSANGWLPLGVWSSFELPEEDGVE